MYNTKQKIFLIEFFKENPEKQYSAKEISKFLCNNHKIGESTVYRLISKLVNEKKIRRFRGENAKSVVYQYAGDNNQCDRHFHLKCTECGALIHLNCEHMDKLNGHINAHHNFDIDISKTVLYGLCKNCKKGEAQL